MIPTAACPSHSQLAGFAVGKLPDADIDAVAAHLETCAACRDFVAQAPRDTLVGLLKPTGDYTRSIAGAAAPTAADDVPPELARHPKYRVLKPLGRGGMGAVFLAEHTEMGRKVALKVMNPGLMASPEAAARFRQEVRTTAQLDHPNIVKAHDAETVGGLQILVMEYVEGASLDKLLAKKGPLPVRTACHFARQAALGLQHGHEKGMVHRDVKPANLMTTRSGQVKLLDFGLAKLKSDQPGLTHQNVVMGTPEYLAPEQAKNAAAADIRADVYSLGCTLFHLLTGRVPFLGASAFDIMLQHLEAPPPVVTDLRPDAPPALAALVARMLAKDPAARPQTPKEVAAALAPFVKEPAATARPAAEPGDPFAGLDDVPPSEPRVQPARPRRRLWAGGVVALALLAAAVGAAYVLRVKTAHGVIEITGLPDDAEVFVDDAKTKIRWSNDATTAEVEVTPDTPHRIRARVGADTLEGEVVSVARGGRKPVTFALKPVQAKAGPNPVPAPPAVAPTHPTPPPPDPSSKAPAVSPAFTNGLGMAFARVPKGTARLGGRDGKPGNREAEIPYDFYLGVYEVTQEEWRKVMGTNPGRLPPGATAVAAEELKRLPVNHVSWFDCRAFVKRLNEQLKEPGWEYRLPTELEWEYACRGGPGQPADAYGFSYYPGEPTNTLRPDRANFSGTGLKRPGPVGAYAANRLGLYDMHGNVAEWCDDERVPPDASGKEARVNRGGSWWENADYCRPTWRSRWALGAGYAHVGLRVARVPAGQAAAWPPDR